MGQDSHRHAPAACPRCGRTVHEPTVWSSAWRCDWHGEVHPLLPAFSPSREGLDGLLRGFRPGTAGVPVWLPWPLPVGWLVAGFASAGDERTGVRACAVALSGPNPLGGPADMVVVAEEPGVGLGAALAGLDGVDPGAGFCSAPPVATASFGNNHFPLWQVDSPDRAVFAGEVKGHWLWLVLWPDTAGALLVEPIGLRDLRDPGQDLDLPFGAVSPRLPGPLMRADLHVHSSASDGTDPPAEVMRRAARAGLDVVALTDHDTVAGHAEARLALPGPLTLLPGMELSCRLDDRSLHLLAYLFDPGHPELAAELVRIRDDRVLRAQAMVRRLEDLGVGVSWDQVAAIAGPAVVGRPHIARAMAASGAIASPREAFTRDWIGDGGRAYVGRYALDPVRAIRLVRDAGGVAVLAHPRAGRDWVVSDEEIGRLAAAGLAGVEVFHPDHPDTERAGLLALAHDLGLVATGGSDDHGSLTGYRIGCETVGADAYQALIARAAGYRA